MVFLVHAVDPLEVRGRVGALLFRRLADGEFDRIHLTWGRRPNPGKHLEDRAMGRQGIEADYLRLIRHNDYCEARFAATCEFVGELEGILRAAAGRAFGHNDLIGIAQGLKCVPAAFDGLESRLEKRAHELIEAEAQLLDFEKRDRPELGAIAATEELQAECVALKARNEHVTKEIAAADEFFRDFRAQVEQSLRFSGRLDVMRLAEHCTKLIPVLSALSQKTSSRGDQLFDQLRRLHEVRGKDRRSDGDGQPQ